MISSKQTGRLWCIMHQWASLMDIESEDTDMTHLICCNGKKIILASSSTERIVKSGSHEVLQDYQHKKDLG